MTTYTKKNGEWFNKETGEPMKEGKVYNFESDSNFNIHTKKETKFGMDLYEDGLISARDVFVGQEGSGLEELFRGKYVEVDNERRKKKGLYERLASDLIIPDFQFNQDLPDDHYDKVHAPCNKQFFTDPEEIDYLKSIYGNDFFEKDHAETHIEEKTNRVGDSYYEVTGPSKIETNVEDYEELVSDVLKMSPEEVQNKVNAQRSKDQSDPSVPTVWTRPGLEQKLAA